MSTYDPNSLEGYTMIRAEESMGSKSTFGIKIFVKDTERDEMEIPVNRHGKKSKFDQDEDWRCISEAMKMIMIGLRGQTERMKPDFAEKKAKEKEYYRKIFTDAGLDAIYMEELPNGYCREGWCCLDKPWFKVTTSFGHVTIGWRKSVINLDWTESDVKKSGAELFPNEDATKGGQYSDSNQYFIHCWGDKKAVEYLKVLKAAAETKP